ncbi:uncharacterized protein LOC123720874 isoform X2 [Pieris brassicae]|uniref:uncharacterized protein LOC123720874 isoform X2 n=1 Tax=Pieris brassicae TaxID=7116 RepID=UPI001E6611E2|nr:uncharacterized protein LOC123720874 isoform X2 [Pieris brassicae]
MHLGFFFFFMGVAPVYLKQEVPDPQKLYENPKNRLCPNNKILLDVFRYLKDNLIDDASLTLSPDNFKQILDTTIQYLNTTYGSDDITGNYTSHLKTILENFNHREKKEVLRSDSHFAVPPETLKGNIGLQFELPTINHPDCETLFKAIVNAINTAYLHLNSFCVESGKCNVQSEKIVSAPWRGAPILPQINNLPPSNQLTNRSNIIDFLGSYPQNGDVIDLLQNYKPNTEYAVKSNFWSEIKNNIPNVPPPSAQGNLFHQVQDDKANNGNQNPDPLTILQSFRPKYIEMIKSHGLPIPQGVQINSAPGLQENGNLWNILQDLRPNTSAAVIKELPHSGHLVSTVINEDTTGNWDDLTRHQDVVEGLTILNQPTGYISVPRPQDVMNQPNGIFQIQNHTLLKNNYTAPASFFTPQLNMKPVYNDGVATQVNKNIVDLTANIPWDNNLRLNANVPIFLNYDLNRNIPTPSSGFNIPYIEKNMGVMPSYEGNGFNMKPPMNIQTGKYYANLQGLPQVSQNGKQYLNQNYYNRIKQYYPSVPLNPNLKLPTSNVFIEKQISTPQFSNWYRNPEILQNPFQYRGMTNLPNNILHVNQFPHYQTGATNISKELIDLYRPTMANGAKLNIAPNKDGIVELTFALQRPQSFVYKPLYYVKYRLPYQTYKYNVQNILQKRPFLRNSPSKLYEELIEVANISESSQDLKHLAKEEISKLVVTNGALVKAKMIDELVDKKATIENDIKSVLNLASNLNPVEMLNATKKALNQVEEVLNTTDSKTNKPNEDNETSEIPVKVLNARSISGYPLYPHLSSSNNLGVQPYITKNNVVMPTNFLTRTGIFT